MPKTRIHRSEASLSPRSDRSPWRELVGDFIATQRTRDPEGMREVLLCTLENANGWDDLLTGRWILLAPTHRYLHFDGRGWGDARTFQAIEKLVRWLHGRNVLSGWLCDRLLDAVDEGRESVGLTPKAGIRARERVFVPQELPAVVEAFRATIGDPDLRYLAPSAIRLLHVTVGSKRAPSVRFGGVEPEDLALLLTAPDPESEPPVAEEDRASANRALLRIYAAFYRWLGREGYLDHGRARDLAARFDALVLSVRSRPAVA